MSDFATFMTENRTTRIKVDIEQRWQERVVAQGLRGTHGAQFYLQQYGKSIAAPKCIQLACKAEQAGDQPMARYFWAKAYVLANRLTNTPDEILLQLTHQTPVAQPVAVPAPTTKAPASETERLVGALPCMQMFPEDIRLGKFITMQPTDAGHDRKFYCEHPKYWGQPKRDGVKMLVFVYPDMPYILTQSRQMKVSRAPSPRFEEVIKKAAKALGTFIVEGELYYKDFDGHEHRSGAQALTANRELGHPEAQPQMVYAIFSALCFKGESLLDRPQSRRVAAGQIIAQYLATEDADMFEVLPLASRQADKFALSDQQLAEGREGEVWFDATMPYHAGKDRSDAYVRTKYLEEFDAFISNLTPTTADNHAFGAMEIVSDTGKPLGAIGTGFTLTEKEEILRRHTAAPGKVQVRIRSQGFTENGMVWHGRFTGFAE